jgi:hypothetical protein
MAGVDLTTVKTLLGHKDLTMTLRYSHLAPAHIRSALTILDAALTGSQLDNYLTIGAPETKKGSAVAGEPLDFYGGPSQN